MSSLQCHGDNHIYVLGGQPPIPDGWPCACGMTLKRICSHCHGSGLEPSLLSNAPLTDSDIKLGQAIAKKYGLEDKP